MVTKEMIVSGLKELGLKNGDIALVHSSLSSFGHVDGGADTVIDALLETVGREGTIVVPVLTGSEALSAENPPVFDVRTTPCWTGKIPETFRKRETAIRSLHPTHSVAAIGANAKNITSGHEKCMTPCGLNSPYHKIAQAGGYVLFLGVDLNCCTMFHTAEELANVDYVLQNGAVNATVTDYSGAEHKLSLRIHKYGDERDFPKMEPMLMEKKIMTKGIIGKSNIRLLKARQFLELAVEILKAKPDFVLQSVLPR